MQSSMRQLRSELIRFMPPWMNTENILLEYMDLSSFTVVQKTDALYVDGTPYVWTTTIGALKTALSIAGTGDYDVCVIDLIEEIVSGKVFIETNTNLVLLDAIAETIVDWIIANKNQAIREMNPLLATSDFGIPYWEAMFGSERQTVLGVFETDAQYMIRAVAELFALSTSLINITNLFDQLTLQPYTFINTRNDSFQFNPDMWPYSVNMRIHGDDEAQIPVIRQIFNGASAAGIRLLLMCNVFDQGYGYSFGANYGGYDGTSDYVPVAPFITEDINLIGFGAGYGSYYPG